MGKIKTMWLLLFIFIYITTPTIAFGQESEEEDFIHWLDFTPTFSAMKKAMDIDIETHDTETPIDWIDILAYLANKYGGNFKQYDATHIDELAEQILAGEPIETITEKMKYFSYYKEAYTAVLGEFMGEYWVQKSIPEEEDQDILSFSWERQYGLKAFSPIAKGYYYQEFEDFGASRTYGYKRKHQGHDIFAQTGTPIIAVESGIVEALGWNQYGGWRIGIRSLDGKRYYYYAHLRKDDPYHKDLYEGKIVKAGDVIGYMGHTGYSTVENTNNIKETHLHFGMQIIFDESQKDSNHEIWIDLYQISQFLALNKSDVVRSSAAKQWNRKQDFYEESLWPLDLLHTWIWNPDAEETQSKQGEDSI